MFQRVAFGEPSEFLLKLGNHLTDIDRVEVLTLAPLFVLAIVIGVYPALILDFIQAPVNDILQHLSVPTTGLVR
jgi:NADH:ubiquinone oxidoreductase subunit 4 (subunit M)